MELHRRYQYTAPAGAISEAGITAIQKLLSAQLMSSPEWSASNPTPNISYVPALPDNWEWVWVLPSGEYRGTMPKRVAQYYYKAHSLKVPSGLLSEIGNIARAHSADPVLYDFEIVDSFDWYAGQFGDVSSCFWGGRSGAREMIANNGGRAIRFYQSGTQIGMARAWLVPVQAVHILFNGYGLAGNATLKIARIFADWRGEVYKHIELTNSGSDGGTLFINGGKGYVIGAVDLIDAYDSYDFQWDDVNTVLCASCDDLTHEDNVTTGPDGLSYCNSCFSELFAYCDICHRDRWRDEMNYIDTDDVCDACRDRHYTMCDGCEEDHHNSQIHDHKGSHYCESCYAGITPRK
jgi:hypothetical protein